MQTQVHSLLKFAYLVCVTIIILGILSVTYADNRAIVDKIQRKTIINALHPKKPATTRGFTDSCVTLLVKDWKSHKGQFVAAMDWVCFRPDSVGQSVDEKHMVYLGVFQYDSATMACTLKASDTFYLEKNQELSSIDLAYYRLNESTIAFGLRTSTNFMYAGGGGENKNITLYIVNNSSIVQVMSTLLASSSLTAGEWNDDGTRDHSDNGDETEATLSILKSSSNGYFDILKIRNKQKAVYKWDGSTYATTGTDPVEDVNN